MEVDITYIAKDGLHFKDPLECEAHEKSIGVLPNSVADVIIQLEKHDPKEYIFGILLIRHQDGTGSIYTRYTVCCDSVLEDYVNIGDIAEEKRFMVSTFGELIAELRKENRDDPAQYTIVYDKDLSFSSPGIMASHNPLVWKH